MASVQQAHSASQLNDKAKAKVGKAIEEAKNILANANTSIDQQLATVAGAVHNNQETTLKLHSKNNYQGGFLGNPAEYIPKHGSGAFVHQAPEKLPVVAGSKGAVIYAQYGINNQIGGGLGWLLAWYKPAVGLVGQTNKVYVEAGTVERLDKLGWSEIEKRLDATSLPISRYWDSETGAEASAEIKDHGPDVALVGANFEINNEIPPQA